MSERIQHQDGSMLHLSAQFEYFFEFYPLRNWWPESHSGSSQLNSTTARNTSGKPVLENSHY